MTGWGTPGGGFDPKSPDWMVIVLATMALGCLLALAYVVR